MMLYLVRHGQSVGNERRLFFGRSDHPLTELGREQARQTAEKLRETSFTRCRASDLKRAWDTALICTAGRGVTPEPCPGLREQDMGELEDADWEQANRIFPRLPELLDDWYHVPPPGGEAPEDMARRVGACVDEVIAGGEDTLLVAHNGSLSLVVRHLGLAGEDELMKRGMTGWGFAHGAYTAIRVENGKAELVCLNR